MYLINPVGCLQSNQVKGKKHLDKKIALSILNNNNGKKTDTKTEQELS
jgi:hypothetical protein